ncbi:hypothetical protein [Streptomyces sp. NPDC020747]|uniref:hypothetical protein n=1 Tax=Streptomyces sp. NPDC020747 TaxID=3365086 RepID=UPI0037B966CF
MLSSTPSPIVWPKLRHTAHTRWHDTARMTLTYARADHAPHGRRTEVAGAIATAAMQAGHAVPATPRSSSESQRITPL